MSILDDAIREHLELKRAHGADDAELKKLEDEAFGPPQRPDEIDPFNEAPTEFLLSPSEAAADAPEIGDERARGGRRPNITDLQEAPPAEPATGETDAPTGEAPPPPPPGAALFDAEEDLSPAPDAPPPSPADAAEVPLPPPPVEEAPAAQVPPPVEEAPAPPAADVPQAEEPSAAADVPQAEEPSASADLPASDAPAAEDTPPGDGEPAADAGPDTTERHVIADQPTQMFDVPTHIEEEGAAEAPEAAAAEDPAPEQQPLSTRGPDAEVAGHPPTEEESAEFDFFNEQRLSDELDQALEAPLPSTEEHVAMPTYDDAPPAQGGIFDFESEGRAYEEDPSEEVLRRHDAPEPPSEEYERPSDEYEPPSEEAPRAAAEPPSEEAEIDYDPDTGHEDVLEDTPRFLEDAPEDDDLWFEQKPPKDFDLD